MLSSIIKTLEYSKELIISPDIDGFFSAELLNRKYGSVVVGTYDKNILCLADGVDPKTCLFVDCDMNTKDYVSIGNHMRLQDDNMADLSFNPNRFYETKNYWQKYPMMENHGSWFPVFTYVCRLSVVLATTDWLSESAGTAGAQSQDLRAISDLLGIALLFQHRSTSLTKCA